MTHYNKPLPPLFVEADNYINRHLTGKYDDLFENGNNPNGKERWHLRYLYARIKAVVVGQIQNINDESIDVLFAAIDESLLSYYRDNGECLRMNAVKFNLHHQSANPNMDVKDAKTRHHKDYNDKDYNNGGLGKNSEYNKTADDTPAEPPKMATAAVKSPNQSIPVADVPMAIQHQIDSTNRRLGKLDDIVHDLAANITTQAATIKDLTDIINLQHLAIERMQAIDTPTRPSKVATAAVKTPVSPPVVVKDDGAVDDTFDNIVAMAKAKAETDKSAFERVRENLRAKSPQPVGA